MLKKISSLAIAASLLCGALPTMALTFDPATLINFSDIETLSKTNEHSDSLSSKLKQIYSTPMTKQVPNPKTGFQSIDNHGKIVRIAQWNVERGLNIKTITQLFNNPDGYLKENLEQKDIEEKTKHYRLVKEDIEKLTTADIFVINEADYGVNRTGYKNITEEIANVMNAGYSYITEFVEVDKKLLDSGVDKNLYKGLHGTAVISKFPIKKTWVHELPLCYDWFTGERKRVTLLEKSRRLGSKIVFNQKIPTEVRQGGRRAIFTEITLPNQDTLTVVATHFENRATPRCRVKQTQSLLNAMKDIKTPLILAGDLNTTESDIRPTSLTRLYVSKLSDPAFMARTISSAFNPLALIVNTSLFTGNFFRKFKDPTAKSVPMLFQNKARRVFTELKDFEFSDGNQFDFSGENETSAKGRGAYLSNSNERWLKGYVETFQLERAYKVMRYKLDWLLAKPVGDENTKHYYPVFGRTLKKLNYSYKDYRIADHTPITVDLVVNK